MNSVLVRPEISWSKPIPNRPAGLRKSAYAISDLFGDDRTCVSLSDQDLLARKHSREH